jgi:hypothetical protein
MCRIGSDGRSFLYNRAAVVSEALVPFGQARDGHLCFVRRDPLSSRHFRRNLLTPGSAVMLTAHSTRVTFAA